MVNNYRLDDYTICPICKKKFISSIKHRKYCSEKCFKENRKHRKYDKNRYIRRITCKHCGEKDTTYKNFYKSGCCMSVECIEKDKRLKKSISKKYNKKKKSNQITRYKINKKSRFRKKTLRNLVNNIKKTKKCNMCNESRFYCLEFHHLDNKDKKNTVSRLISRQYGKKTVLKEINKCIVLCNNCHAEEHHKEIKYASKRYERKADQIRKWLDRYKSQLRCEKCGYNKNIRAIVFHHINPKNKTFSMCNAQKYTTNKKKIIEEINKCSVLCKNCHAETHYLKKHGKTISKE